MTLKILFIDDEENILGSLKRVFRKAPFETMFTSQPDDAFELIKQHQFAVVVCDQRMPKLEGVEVLKQVNILSPESVRIMLTGYADIKSAMRAVNEGKVFCFLAKPWNEEELRAAISSAIAQFELVQENKRLTELAARQNEELREFNENLEGKVKERTAEVAKLNTELSKAFFSAIKIMGSLSGIISPDREGRTLRVAKTSGYIARELGLGDREIFETEVAAFVHDIGTLAPLSPDLSPDARKQEEVKLGARVASLIPNIGHAPLAVLHQLERFDGSGFPNKLAGLAIPVGARIVAVAAAFDFHLFSGTPKNPDKLEALAQVKKGVDSAFDPVVIQALEHYVRSSLQEAGKEFQVALGMAELRAGMIVARSVRSHRGEILVNQGFKLNEEILESLWQRQMNDRPVGDIYIYESSLPQVKKVAKAA